MSPAEAIGIARASLWVTVELGAPIMIVALISGLVVGLFQALTSVQELTLTFVPKLLVVGAMIWLNLAAMFVTLSNFFSGPVLDAMLGV